MKRILKRVIPAPLKNIMKKILRINTGLQARLSTSISDNQLYPDFCLKASIDKKIFSNFRRNAIYQEILEHVSYKVGVEYLAEIKKNNSELLQNIETFKKNDEWGNPKVYNYPEIGTICPTTLRYIKVYGDLLSLFKRIDGLNICEIGVGYGGQCRIIHSASSPSEYTLIDIKPALMLAQSYLDNYVLNSVLKYKTMNELEIQNYDLLISNYAFSELPRSVQDVYLKKIIINSKRGYITIDDMSPEYFQSYKREELLSIIPNSRLIEEKPLTYENNCILIWGDHL